ncbi:zinc finger and SCAN domain-containing protein 21-like isoform X1 [Nerophis ophidion]|uniref:zinc finger and SCAN domain-containing protein 21-like isoform X1 n=1 Tax=Nerophis ophidion TaxID=159077 RepID=UPI002ADF4BB5|nr:zinc finger and SCAN domain-containing protein 21-like isoform X1 [Nerophis ophidion]
MYNVRMLRAWVNQRLTVAVEEIFVVLERTVAEYEEELSRIKEENKRQRQLLHAFFKPRLESHISADISDYLPPGQREWSARMEQKEPQPYHLKEEEEELQPTNLQEEEEEPQLLHIKEEKEDHGVCQVGEQLEGLEDLSVISVVVKSEYDDDKSENEVKRKGEPPSTFLTQHMTAEADGDHSGASTAETLFARLSDNDDTLRNPDTDDEDSTSDKAWHAKNPLSCSECGKTFSHMGNLNVHMKIHTGEKPFNCSVCGKRFFRKAHLTSHTRIHTGERPFSCSICGISFTRGQYLKIHIRRHTGEKPFSCSICNKSFCDRRTLVAHTRTHSSEKVLSCSVCDERFSYKYQFTNHKCAGENSSSK